MIDRAVKKRVKEVIETFLIKRLALLLISFIISRKGKSGRLQLNFFQTKNF